MTEREFISHDGTKEFSAVASLRTLTTSARSPPPLTKAETIPDKNFADNEDEILIQTYCELYNEDRGFKNAALDAYFEEWQRRRSVASENLVVDRRAPYNPLAKKSKSKDPALRNNPLSGRLIALYSTTAALVFVFLQTLIGSYELHGRAFASWSANGMLGPEPQVLYDLGGLNTNAIRNHGGAYRLFWAAWMHAGVIHIGFNILCQLQFFFMFEPDWGFWRSFLLFWVAGVTGNLLSATLDPCTTTVGSSGGLFGLMGAMVPYCIGELIKSVAGLSEYWTTIPRPGCILIFSAVVIVLSILVGFTGSTDNWAHMGGLLGGILFAFGTTTRLSAFDPTPPKRLTAAQSGSKSGATLVALSDAKSGSLVGRGKSTLSEIEIVPKAQSAEQHFSFVKSLTGKLEPQDLEVQDTIVIPSEKGEEVESKTGLGTRTEHSIPQSAPSKAQKHKKYSCARREWIVRISSLSLLIVLWIVLFVILFVNYEFQPPGHVTFTEVSSCSCCFQNLDGSEDPRAENHKWFCFPSRAAPSGWPISWGTFCALTPEEIKTRYPYLPPLKGNGAKA